VIVAEVDLVDCVVVVEAQGMRKKEPADRLERNRQSELNNQTNRLPVEIEFLSNYLAKNRVEHIFKVESDNCA
jgi:hypothetical protein